MSQSQAINYVQTSTFKELSKEQLANVDIDLPNLEIQQHIVNTISILPLIFL